MNEQKHDDARGASRSDAGLGAEMNELIADAERYRWLRDAGQKTVEVFLATDNNASGWGCWDSWDDKDAAIDAAMNKAKVPNA